MRSATYTAGVRVRSIHTGADGTVRCLRARPVGSDDPGPWYTVDWDNGFRGIAHHDDIERVDE